MIMYTDGGARGNPGPSGCGVIIKDDSENILREFGFYIGKTTNNAAEYLALLLGLKFAAKEHKAVVKKLPVSVNTANLTCYLDSELIVKQLNGEYKVKNENLKDLYDKTKALEKVFSSVKYIHVLRAKNKDADRMVNEVLDIVSK